MKGWGLARLVCCEARRFLPRQRPLHETFENGGRMRVNPGHSVIVFIRLSLIPSTMPAAQVKKTKVRQTVQALGLALRRQ